MAVLSKEQLLNSDTREVRTVPVPELDGEILIRELSGSARFQIQKYNDKEDYEGASAYMLAESAVDEDGNRLFSHKEAIKFMGNHGKTVQHIVEEIKDLNGFTEDSEEDAEKN